MRKRKSRITNEQGELIKYLGQRVHKGWTRKKFRVVVKERNKPCLCESHTSYVSFKIVPDYRPEDRKQYEKDKIHRE